MLIRQLDKENDSKKIWTKQGVQLKCLKEIEETFGSNKTWTSAEFISNVIIPKTAEDIKTPFTYLADLLIDKKYLSNDYECVFISHAWKYNFKDLIDGLIHELGEETYVWLDFLCVAQPPNLINDSTWLSDGLTDLINNCQNRLVLFDSWSDPLPLKRSWCVFELMHAIQTANGDLQVGLMLGQDEEIIKNFKTWENSSAMPFIVTAEKAEAFSEQDKKTIDSLIESTIGFDKLNEIVQHKTTKWFSSICDAEVNRRIQHLPKKEQRLRLLYRVIGMLLRLQGFPELSIKYTSKAVEEARIELKNNIIDYDEFSSDLNALGESYKDSKQFNKAIEIFGELLETNPNDWFTNTKLYEIYMELKDFKKAESFARNCIKHHPNEYSSYKDVALAIIPQNKLKEAKKFCETGKKLLEEDEYYSYEQLTKAFDKLITELS